MFSSAALLSLVGLIPANVLGAPLLGDQPGDRFTLYDLPTPLTGPCDLENGPDGALWGQGILDNIIFRIDPTTGQIDEYPIPFTTPLSPKPIPLPGVLKFLTDRTALSCAIRNGADGNLYAANGVRNQLVRINPLTKKIDLFQTSPPSPLGNLQPFNDLYTAHDGIWVTATSENTFSFFSFETAEFTTYNVPTPASFPLGLYVASDGLVYIAELIANKILTFDPKTKSINEYPLPELAQLPAVIRAEKDGFVYFSMVTGNGIGRIDMNSHQIELFHTTQPLLLGAEDTMDKSGGVWLSAFSADVLSRLDTATLEFSYVAFPNSFAQVGLPGVLGAIPPAVDVAVNYGPGDAIWFTNIVSNQVGRYDLAGLYQ